MLNKSDLVKPKKKQVKQLNTSSCKDESLKLEELAGEVVSQIGSFDELEIFKGLITSLFSEKGLTL